MFSFSLPSQEIGLGNVSEMTYFVSSGRSIKPQLNQSMVVIVSGYICSHLQSYCGIDVTGLN